MVSADSLKGYRENGKTCAERDCMELNYGGKRG